MGCTRIFKLKLNNTLILHNIVISILGTCGLHVNMAEINSSGRSYSIIDLHKYLYTN